MSAGESWQRRAGAATLITLVALVHGCVADEVADRFSLFDSGAAMPPRLEVLYVREMEPSVPPPVVRAPAPSVPRAPRRRAAAPALPAASAPEPQVVAQAPPEPPPVESPQESPGEVPGEPPAPEMAPAQDAASAPATAASAPSFEWPVSTRVSYVLTGYWRGEIHGGAQVEWVHAGGRYQVHLDVVVGLPFSPLYTRRMTSDGHLSPDGLVPERYDEEQKLIGRDRRQATIRFEPDGVLLPNGQRLPPWPGVQDQASQFVQLTYLFTLHPELLTPGRTIEVPLALPRHVDRWVYDVLGEETLYTPFGAVQAVHLQPRRVSRPGGDLAAEIWFAPTLAYLPARILIHQDSSTFIDLVIKRKPQLAAR
ncbi:MAG TPA: DUF3108 domain-containing protein [Albitalea sp.]|nr:DUF3108 domain-containing protein [Albitalea sp.]